MLHVELFNLSWMKKSFEMDKDFLFAHIYLENGDDFYFL